jgi:hypothetical protein
MQRPFGRANHEVEVVRHPGPCEAGESLFWEHPLRALEQLGAICVVVEQRSSLDAAKRDVMHRARCIDARSPRHRFLLGTEEARPTS